MNRRNIGLSTAAASGTPGKRDVRLPGAASATSADTLGDEHADRPAAATACPVAR